MLVTEPSRTTSPTAATPPGDVQLRLHGGSRSRELVPIAPGTHSVGSAPHCSVRLAEPGVRPLHCLIVLDAGSISVRRWSHDTLLNGAPFDQAILVQGDMLSIGPINLEVVLPYETSEPEVSELEASDLEVLEEEPEAEADFVVDVSEYETVDDAVKEVAERPIAVTEIDEDDEPPRETPAAVSNRRRRFLEELERNRQEHDELAQRLAELERIVQEALADRIPTNPHESDTDADVEDWSVGGKPAVHLPQPLHGEEVVELSSAAMVPDPIRNSVKWGVVDPPAFLDAGHASGNEEFETELSHARAELDDGKLQLAAALATIDALERQLADNQREQQSFADERAGWHAQFAELEASAKHYVERIAELEHRLEQHTESNHGNVARKSEPVESRDIDSSWVASQAVSADPTDIEYEVNEDRDVAAEADSFPSDEPAQASLGGYDWGAPKSEDVAPATHDHHAAPKPSESEDLWSTSAGHDDPRVTPVVESVDECDEDPFAPAQPTSEPAASESAEVDDALAHLRELSLWRNTESDAGVAADAEASRSESRDAAVTPEPTHVAEPTAEAAPSQPSGPPAGSFIERYAHMFEDDASAAPAPTAMPEPVRPHVAEPVSTRHDDEESIELYMSKMMDRLRGTSASPSPIAEHATVGKTSPESPGGVLEPTNAAGASGSHADATEANASGAEPSESVDGELKRKTPPPVFEADMDALRALANETARFAIGVHTKKMLRRDATTRFIISMLAGMTSLFFALDAPGWDSLQFATSCVALLASFNWARLTFTSLVKAVRMGAYDKVEGDFLAVDASQPSLPIDVKR